jgi:hypothetical protein
MYVQEEGHMLETHDDVPANIREELYAEEQKSLERHQKASGTSTTTPPTVHITNVLPTPSQTSDLASSTGTLAPDLPSTSAPIVRLNIPGFLDEQAEEYCIWQQSRVKRPDLKVEYQKAFNAIIEDGMDLELIRRDPNPKILTDKGVKKGPAEHVVGDIDYWIEKVKRARNEE